MTEQHTLTPPPELRNKWLDEAPITSVYDYLIESAAQWGADQELEACCKWLAVAWKSYAATELRAARRPKPPSLKEQALKLLPGIKGEYVLNLCPFEVDTIRRALEALPND